MTAEKDYYKRLPDDNYLCKICNYRRSKIEHESLIFPMPCLRCNSQDSFIFQKGFDERYE
jgi:hypothetical protein